MQIGSNVQSEVACLMQQIAAEEESAMRALNSAAYGTAQHAFITRRMERMSEMHERMKEIVGDEEANKIFVKTMEGKHGAQQSTHNRQ